MTNDDPQWGGTRKGAGRKPAFSEPCRSQPFILPDRLIDKLARLAKREHETINRYLAQILEDLK